MTTGDVQDLELRLEPRAECLLDARHRLARWLASAGVPQDVAGDLLVAVGELCTNAVQAARAHVDVRARIERESVMFEVEDDGEGFTGPVPEIEPDPTAERGRGLYMVQKLVDVMWLSSDVAGGGTVARCARRFR